MMTKGLDKINSLQIQTWVTSFQIIETFADRVVFVSKLFLEILDCVEQYLKITAVFSDSKICFYVPTTNKILNV